MLKRKLLSYLAAVLLVYSCRAHSTEDDRANRVESGLLPMTATKDRMGALTDVKTRMRAYGVNGLSIAVVDNGRLAWARGYGVADSNTRTPVIIQTLFQAASISKPIAALGALSLVNAGKLSLDENVNGRLKGWQVPENQFTRNHPVTLRTLLNHSAGVTNPGPTAYELGESSIIPDEAEMLSATPAAHVESIPGSAFQYSAGGYTVVQKLIIDVTGESFDQFVAANVLRPIGMQGSTFERPLTDSRVRSAAKAYLAGGEPVAERRDAPYLAVAGLWSTPSDIARYIIYVQNSYAGMSGAPLSPKLTRLMLTPGLGTRGLGPVMSGQGQDLRFGHDGFNEGFESSMVGYVRRGQGAVVMANSGFAFMLIQEVLGSVSRAYGWAHYAADHGISVLTRKN